MHPLSSGFLVTVTLASTLSVASAQDGPYFPKYSNKPLVAPSGDTGLNSTIPPMSPASSIPTYAPTNSFTPQLQPTPAGSSPTNTLKPEPQSSIPATNSAPVIGSPQPTMAVPGTISQFDPGPQPYWTGFRGMGWFGARAWNQQTNYGPMPDAFGGGGCPTCPTCPPPVMNWDFGRAYDGFMTGW